MRACNVVLRPHPHMRAPAPLSRKPEPNRWSRCGRYAAALGFWFFLIKGLVWLALFASALFAGAEVVQASPMR